MKDLRKSDSAFSILWKLSMFLTWSSHSILRELISFCNEAVALLDEFDLKLDLLQPVCLWPLPQFSSRMITRDSREYTLLAIRCNKALYNCTLQYVYDMQSMLVEKLNVTQHCLQLLVVKDNPTVFYWTVPKCIVKLIINIVPQHSEYFCSRIASVS